MRREPIIENILEKNNKLKDYIIDFNNYISGNGKNIEELYNIIELISSYNRDILELKNIVLNNKSFYREEYIKSIYEKLSDKLNDDYNTNIESNTTPNILYNSINMEMNIDMNNYLEHYIITYQSIIQKYNEINNNYNNKNYENDKLISDYMIININLIILWYDVDKYVGNIMFNKNKFNEIVSKKISLIIDDTENLEKIKIIMNNIILSIDSDNYLYKIQKILKEAFNPNISIVLIDFDRYEKKYKDNITKDNLLVLFCEILYDCVSS